jgi:hypothetical protein
MKTYFSSFWLGLSLFAIASPPPLVLAQSFSQPQRSPQKVLERILVSKKLESKWFSPQVLEAMPLPKLQEALDQLRNNAREELGAYKSVQFIQDDKYRIMFERGSVVATVQLDQNGSVTIIGFSNPEKL